MKLLILLLIYLVFVSGCSSVTNEVCINENCFFVEIADTDREREIGLMNRTYLDRDKGMLFIFDNEGHYSFWMKDTFIPLDIIWIDSGNKIVFIKDKVSLCMKNECEIIEPNVKAKYVLEINSGLVKELDIKIGDELKFN